VLILLRLAVLAELRIEIPLRYLLLKHTLTVFAVRLLRPSIELDIEKKLLPNLQAFLR
jgi:hypothetical protein